MTFCPEHPKRDQNPKFTPLSETTSIPVHFIWESPPPPPPPPPPPHRGERFAHNTVFAPTRRKVRSVHSARSVQVRSKAKGSLTTQCSLPQGGRFAQYTVFTPRQKVAIKQYSASTFPRVFPRAWPVTLSTL